MFTGISSITAIEYQTVCRGDKEKRNFLSEKPSFYRVWPMIFVRAHLLNANNSFWQKSLKEKT
jgi:hypothetical protein